MSENNVVINAKKAIIASGLKQKVVAERMNISYKKLSNILTGRKMVDANIVISLCRALDVSPNELFGYNTSAQGRRRE